MKKIVKVIKIDSKDCKVLLEGGEVRKRNWYHKSEKSQSALAGKDYFELNKKLFAFSWLDDDSAIEVQDFGVSRLFYLKEREEQKKSTKVIESIKKVMVVDTEKEIHHKKFEQIKTCIENNIPVYLVGPAGSGKNHTLEQIAKDLDMDFYFTNSVQQEYKITGFIDAGGNYHETEFYKAFKNGGLFFLDEMDASIPEVLVLLNAAIANGYFEFPNGKITAHKDFRVVAAGNTFGNGADEQYTGRLVLDQATLDRFAVIDFGYDMRIELHLAKGNKKLVDFIEDLRKQADMKGIRATFSYRAITMVTKLEGKLNLTEILIMSVFKGLDKDTMKTFNTYKDFGSYTTALKEIQG